MQLQRISQGRSLRRMLGWILVVGTVALLGTGCTSQKEQRLSALHYFQRGNAAFQAEDYRRAIMHYRRAIEFQDTAPELHYNLGLAYYRVKAYDNAIEAYKRAIDLDSEFADAHHNLALAYNKEYNLEAANRHFNLYRNLTAVPTENAGEQEPPSDNQAGATRQVSSRKATGEISKRIPVQRQAAVEPRQNNPFEGNGNKWWNVDPGNRNR